MPVLQVTSSFPAVVQHESAHCRSAGARFWALASEEFLPGLSCYDPNKNNPIGGLHAKMARAEWVYMGSFGCGELCKPPIFSRWNEDERTNTSGAKPKSTSKYRQTTLSKCGCGLSIHPPHVACALAVENPLYEPGSRCRPSFSHPLASSPSRVGFAALLDSFALLTYPPQYPLPSGLLVSFCLRMSRSGLVMIAVRDCGLSRKLHAYE